jgi:hypothetical protein
MVFIRGYLCSIISLFLQSLHQILRGHRIRTEDSGSTGVKGYIHGRHPFHF